MLLILTIGEPVYREYLEDEDEEIDLLPVKGERLVIQRVLYTLLKW